MSVISEDDAVTVFPYTPVFFKRQASKRNELACLVVLQPFSVKSLDIIVAITTKPSWEDRLNIFQTEFTHNPFTENLVPTEEYTEKAIPESLVFACARLQPKFPLDDNTQLKGKVN